MNAFIGELPPPYGGVAIKDKLLLNEIYAPIGVKMVDLVECKRKPWKIPLIGLRLVWYLLIANHLIIGVGTNQRSIFLMSLRRLLRGKRGLRKTHFMAMGGRIQETTKVNITLKKLLLESGSVWVETKGIGRSLEEQGFINVNIYPNCRVGNNAILPIAAKEAIKFVFFSRICKEKGVDEIISAFGQLKGRWSLDFYGEVESSYRKTFEAFVDEHAQVRYHGVFDSANENVCNELNQYDVMLLPSKWIGEGVPGALVEAKMSGITAIVSDWNFNSEIVEDGKDGLVIHEDLYHTICGLTVDSVNSYKKQSYISRKKYDVSLYKECLQSELYI